jgi:hypothetical protein
MGVRTWEPPPEDEPPPPPLGPSAWTALALALLLWFGLVSNGRPWTSPESQAAERRAVALAQGRLAPEEAAPLLPSLLAAPLFAALGAAFSLEGAGTGLCGKLSASLFSAAAAAALFLAVGWRRPQVEAAAAAALLALGTGLWAASQALWPQPAAALLVALAVLSIVRAEHRPGGVPLAGLSLGLVPAADPAALALAIVLFLGVAVRWPRRLPALLLGLLPGAAFIAASASDLLAGSARPAGPLAGSPLAHLALLVSPAQGWLVFAPLVVVAAAGLRRAFARGERWLAGTLGAAALVHWVFVGALPAAAGGGPWGPRLLAPALPLLLLFLPEGLDAMGRAGSLLAALSVAVQVLGAFGEGQRWERLHGPLPNASMTWDVARSPLALHLTERVLRPALPASSGGRLVIREHPLVVLGPRGARVSFSEDGLAVRGTDETCRDVHLQGGARVDRGRLRLAAAGDALFLRATPSARVRPLELRIVGRGRGTLRVAEATFWSDPRLKSYAVAGSFRLRHPYDYPESGGPDLTISLAGGEASLESVSLVPSGAPDHPIEAPAGP